jgi:cell division protein ZapA
LASVNVTINGRQFRIGCEDGQEQHIEKLATDFDALIADLRGRMGEVGDARLTIMAALTVADDLSEALKKIRGLEAELFALKEARVAFADRNDAAQAAVAAAFIAAAERLEGVAKKLNQGLGPPTVAVG